MPDWRTHYEIRDKLEREGVIVIVDPELRKKKDDVERVIDQWYEHDLGRSPDPRSFWRLVLALWVEFGAFVERTEHQNMLVRSDRAARKRYVKELFECAMREQSEKCQEMLYDTRRLLYIPSDALALAILHHALDLMVHCLRHRHIEAAESEKMVKCAREKLEHYFKEGLGVLSREDIVTRDPRFEERRTPTPRDIFYFLFDALRKRSAWLYEVLCGYIRRRNIASKSCGGTKGVFCVKGQMPSQAAVANKTHAELARGREAEELAREVEAVATALAKEDAVVVELARKVLERWLTNIKMRLPPLPGLRWESHVDRVAVRISLVLSPGDVETENKVLERLSVLHATYGLERRETTTEHKRFIYYIVDLERHENFRRLVDVMKGLYKLALDEVRRAMPAESYSKVVATALEALNNWISIHDVYVSLALSPSLETLKRLLAMYPLVKTVERETRPGVAERRREVVPARRQGPSLEEEYRRTFMNTIREMAIRDDMRSFEIGALITREPDGTTMCWGVMDDRVCFYNTPRECVELCMARLIDALYRADRITREEWEDIRKALNAGLYRVACRAIRQNMDYFQTLYGVENPPRYCEKTGF
jgi:hypothetical protein